MSSILQKKTPKKFDLRSKTNHFCSFFCLEKLRIPEFAPEILWPLVPFYIKFQKKINKLQSNKITFLQFRNYSLINRRQLHIFCTQAKTWHQIVWWFTWISLNFQVLARSDHKIVLFFNLQNNFLITSCKNLENQGNSGKSTNNPMSSFHLIEENMELSHTD